MHAYDTVLARCRYGSQEFKADPVYSKVEASLGYMRYCLNTKEKETLGVMITITGLLGGLTT